MDIPQLDPDVKLLTMCSSHQRPDRVQTMIQTFNETKNKETELVIYVSENDIKIDDYRKSLVGTKHIIGPYKTMVQVLNFLSCDCYPDMLYYQEVNDDHAYRTKDWDRKMMKAIDDKKGWAVAYGWTQNLPTAIMMSGKLVKTLGFFLPPQFIHTYVDDFICELSNELNLLVHLPEVVIEHMHPGFGKAVVDENYKWVYSMEQMTIGGQILNEWRSKYRANDIQRVRDAMEREKNELSNR